MSILRRICDAADEQGWVKVAFKVANDKVAEAKVVLDELGYTAYDVEGAMDDDKTIKVSTQHPDETKAKILPKFKQAGITPISTRVTDSNKRLDEYILGSLRKNGIESAVNIEQHKDGFRVSFQSSTHEYLDIYLDGENVVVREAPWGIYPDSVAYARFAGIPERQAVEVVRKFKRWATEVKKLDARPVDELEGLRVTDSGEIRVPAYALGYIRDDVKRETGVDVTVTPEGKTIRIYVNDSEKGGRLAIAEIFVVGGELKNRLLPGYKSLTGKEYDKIDKLKGVLNKYTDNIDFPYRVTDAYSGKAASPLSESDIRFAANAIFGKGNATLKQVKLAAGGFACIVEYKGHETSGLVNVMTFDGRSVVSYEVGGDDAAAQDKIRALANELKGSGKGKVKDSVEDLKLPKFSSNAKLNKLCTDLAEEILAHFTDESTEVMLSDLERYKREHPRELGYNYVQYGNTSIVSYQDAKDALHDAGYSTKVSDNAAWEAVCRTMGQVIRTLLDHKEELLKQKVTDAAGEKYKVSLWPFSGYKLMEYEVLAGSEEEAIERAVVEAIKKGHKVVVPDSEADDDMQDSVDFLYVDATMEGAPYPVYVDATNLRIEKIADGKVYDSAKIKTASLREALKRAGKLTDDVGAVPATPDDVLKQIKRYGADSLYVESDDGEIEITDPESGVDSGVVVRVDKDKLEVSVAPGAPKHIAQLGNFLRDRVAGRTADVTAWESLSDDDLTSKVMDSTSSKSSEDVVKDAIAKVKLKVPAKMQDALLRLAKRKTPIKSVKFGQESHPSAIHNKDAYDFAEVFYEHTASSKHAIVAWDGEVTGALN